MKFKIKKKINTGERALVAFCGKNDVLDFEDAEKLHNGIFRSFLPFRYQKKRSNYVFSYKTDGCISLEALQKRTLNSDQFHEVLLSLLTLLRTCESNQLMMQRVLFSPDRVYFNKEYSSLMFAYVPVKSFAAGAESFQSCVAFVCEQLKLESSYDQAHAREVYSYIMKASIVSSIDYEKNLREIGVFEVEESEDAVETDELRATTGSYEEKDPFGWNFVDDMKTTRARRSDAKLGSAWESQSRPSAPVPAPAPKKPLSLRSLRRISTGEVWRLPEDVSVVGRFPECDIVVHQAPMVSRRHVSVMPQGDAVVVEDVGSTNGTYVGDMPLPPNRKMVLKVGSRFSMGGETFEIC